eukprot:scaffold14894_cov93-Skeletonema_dohrnii-CCMP3373.AAC.2
METCDALGVPCNSTVTDMWMSMAKCKSAEKHIAGDSISISQHNGAQQDTPVHSVVNISILEKDGVKKDMPDRSDVDQMSDP